MIDENIPDNKRLRKIEKFLIKASDEECLSALYLMINSRVGVRVEYVQAEEGLITDQVLVLQAGDKYIASDPTPLDWPMQLMPIPEAFKNKVN